MLAESDTGSSLQAKQHVLERQQATDNLKKGLEHRPEKDELINRTGYSQATRSTD